MLRYTTTKHIAMQDFDALVRETYGRPYKLQQQDGCMERGTINIHARGLLDAGDYTIDIEW